MERGRIQGLPKFLEYPLLSQERIKRGASNLAGIFTGSIRTKALKIWEKMTRGRIQRLPKFLDYPLLSQERVKLRTSNFIRTFLVSIGTKVLMYSLDGIKVCGSGDRSLKGWSRCRGLEIVKSCS